MKDHSKYYHDLTNLKKKLQEKIPKTITGLNTLHKASMADGTLSSKNKELIALGIAIAVRCDCGIAFHVHNALVAGASEEEIIETIGVAIHMGGNPAVVYGCEAFEALDQMLVLEQ